MLSFAVFFFFFFSSRRRHTRLTCDWSSDVCSSDLLQAGVLLTELPVLLLQRRHTREQLCDQPLQLVERSSVQVGKRRRHADQRTTPTCQGKALASAHTMDCPAFLTGYRSHCPPCAPQARDRRARP